MRGTQRRILGSAALFSGAALIGHILSGVSLRLALMFLDAHQMKDAHGRFVGYHNLDRVATTLSSVVIRRRKREVLAQLPERLEKHFFVSMTPEQLAHHEENREVVRCIVAKWPISGA